MKKSIFTALQWTWGLPQTLLGSAVYIANKNKKHFDYNGSCVTLWDRDDGLSLGKFIFLPATSDMLAEHEYGHCIQSLILGPAYLLLVGLPSVLWSRLPYFINKRKKTGKSYYSPVFEKTANSLSASMSRKRKG